MEVDTHSNTDLERQTTNHVAANSRKLSRFSLALEDISRTVGFNSTLKKVEEASLV